MSIPVLPSNKKSGSQPPAMHLQHLQIHAAPINMDNRSDVDMPAKENPDSLTVAHIYRQA
jgi:hypothetical protein